MNWFNLERELLSRGGSAKTARRTGERVWSHPAVERRVRFNLRRKDATRQAIVFLKRVRERDADVSKN